MARFGECPQNIDSELNRHPPEEERILAVPVLGDRSVGAHPKGADTPGSQVLKHRPERGVNSL